MNTLRFICAKLPTYIYMSHRQVMLVFLLIFHEISTFVFDNRVASVSVCITLRPQDRKGLFQAKFMGCRAWPFSDARNNLNTVSLRVSISVSKRKISNAVPNVWVDLIKKKKNGHSLGCVGDNWNVLTVLVESDYFEDLTISWKYLKRNENLFENDAFHADYKGENLYFLCWS